ncbi:hypothetical protein GJ496_009845 [Pomphorhynchus laevis]|nr:hypothetical protein GJ496_009845 [Pomphorhynchus laevis]
MKKHRRYNYKINRKSQHVNAKKRKNAKFANCKVLADKWKSYMSSKRNLESAGLVYDANAALGVPTLRDTIKKSRNILNSVGKTTHPISDPNLLTKDVKSKNKKADGDAGQVVQYLEELAQAKKPNKPVIFKADALHMCYMLDKYGDDCEKMATDERNYYQKTSKQYSKMANLFKSCEKQYKQYLTAKSDGVDFCSIYDIVN